MASKPKYSTADYSADHNDAVRRAKKLKDKAGSGKHLTSSSQFVMPFSRENEPKIDFERQASNAYLKLMLSDEAPEVDSLEHRAVMLMRDSYPATPPAVQQSKSYAVRTAVIRQFIAESGLPRLPEVIMREICVGLRKMTEALQFVYESTLHGCGHSVDTLELAIDKLLVKNDPTNEPALIS